MIFRLQRRCAGEQRCCVSIWTHAKKNEVKLGKGALLRTKKLLQRLFVFAGCSPRVRQLSGNAEDVFWRNWQLREQRLVGHAIVAVRTVGRDVALVAPEEENFVPDRKSTRLNSSH